MDQDDGCCGRAVLHACSAIDSSPSKTSVCTGGSSPDVGSVCSQAWPAGQANRLTSSPAVRQVGVDCEVCFYFRLSQLGVL